MLSNHIFDCKLRSLESVCITMYSIRTKTKIQRVDQHDVGYIL